MSFTALTNIGITSFTVSSATLFITFKPYQARLPKPIVLKAVSTL
jgi:hypothetical protein